MYSIKSLFMTKLKFNVNGNDREKGRIPSNCQTLETSLNIFSLIRSMRI